jgi:hypothetical protein
MTVTAPPSPIAPTGINSLQMPSSNFAPRPYSPVGAQSIAMPRSMPGIAPGAANNIVSFTRTPNRAAPIAPIPAAVAGGMVGTIAASTAATSPAIVGASVAIPPLGLGVIAIAAIGLTAYQYYQQQQKIKQNQRGPIEQKLPALNTGAGTAARGRSTIGKYLARLYRADVYTPSGSVNAAAANGPIELKNLIYESEYDVTARLSPTSRDYPAIGFPPSYYELFDKYGNSSKTIFQYPLISYGQDGYYRTGQPSDRGTPATSTPTNRPIAPPTPATPKTAPAPLPNPVKPGGVPQIVPFRSPKPNTPTTTPQPAKPQPKPKQPRTPVKPAPDPEPKPVESPPFIAPLPLTVPERKRAPKIDPQRKPPQTPQHDTPPDRVPTPTPDRVPTPTPDRVPTPAPDRPSSTPTPNTPTQPRPGETVPTTSPTTAPQTPQPTPQTPQPKPQTPTDTPAPDTPSRPSPTTKPNPTTTPTTTPTTNPAPKEPPLFQPTSPTPGQQPTPTKTPPSAIAMPPRSGINPPSKIPEVVTKIPTTAKPIFPIREDVKEIVPFNPQANDPCQADNPCLAKISDQLSKQNSEILTTKTIANQSLAQAAAAAALFAPVPCQVKKFIACEGEEAKFGTETIYVPAPFVPVTVAQFERLANIEAMQCKECNAVATVPEWWQIPPEGKRPQLVIVYREKLQDEKLGKDYYPVTIPHPNLNNLPVYRDNLPIYQKGIFQVVYKLTDNSKIIINGRDKQKALSFMSGLISLVDGDYINPNAYFQVSEFTQAKFKQIDMIAWRMDYYPFGRATTWGKVEPMWSRKLKLRS